MNYFHADNFSGQSKIATGEGAKRGKTQEKGGSGVSYAPSQEGRFESEGRERNSTMGTLVPCQWV